MSIQGVRVRYTFLESEAKDPYLVYAMLWIRFHKYNYGCIFGIACVRVLWIWFKYIYLNACCRITLPNFSKISLRASAVLAY